MITHPRTRSVLSAITTIALAITLLTATTALAADYTAGTPLSPTAGKIVSSVAVDQSSHDVYVASCGEEEGLACNSVAAGGFEEFNSSGTEVACSLEGAPEHPASVAVDPTTGDIDVLDLTDFNAEGFLSKAVIGVYGGNCGAKQHEFAVQTDGYAPPPELLVDPSGNVIVPSPLDSLFETCSQAGVCSELVGESHGATGATLDASGNLYLASNGSTFCEESGTLGRLVEYAPDGKGGYSQSGAFAGLDGSAGHAEVTSIALDKRTGQVFVGRGCGGSFKIERYRGGGAKIEEFGAGTFSLGSELNYNQLAVDESTGRLYATDSGHDKVQVFNYSGPGYLPLGTSVAGEGSIVCEVEGHEEPCASEYESGTVLTVKGVAGAKATFAKWSTATGSAQTPCENKTSSSCTFTVSAASTVEAEFEAVLLHPVVLTVFKGGSGSGAVKSVSPAGLNCNLACEEGQSRFEEGATVTLEEAPQTGSVFAGWIGCRHVNATTCQITLGTPQSEVTAVFLTEGKEGAAGKEGPAGKTGATGKEGSPGASGAQGAQGATGAQGANGATGAAGPAGPPGAQGPKGEAGPPAKVQCTVKQQHKKTKVTCTVKYPSQARASDTHRSLHWTLTHQDRIVAHGTSVKTSQIKLNYLRHGTYTLYLDGGQHQGTVIHVY